MEPVLQAFEQAAATGLMPGGAAILLAVSGGADSMALLYGAAEKTPEAGWVLSVAHVHHGWRRREADRDLRFVRDHARRLGLPFLFRRRDARAEARRLKLSPEASARHVRYEALSEMARETGASLVATAHQLEDRVESYLLARERGAAGPSLAGPRDRRADGIVRPLLEVRRNEILDFLRARRVSFRRDSTNGDLRLPRNRIRREIARTVGEEGAEAFEALAARVRRLARERNEIEQDFEARVRPSLHSGPGAALADAELLGRCRPDVRRRAIDVLASPFAPPGKAPLTGREAEQILQRIVLGDDFRFEAGRRIRFERRGKLMRVTAAPGGRSPRGNNSPGKSVILEAALEKESPF
jgi:tRNA(Ile)-lysidine synthetase-like protein